MGPCVEAWVDKKFLSADKRKVREQKWPGCNWQFTLVHGVAKDDYELEMMRGLSIETMPLSQILADLHHLPGAITGGAGTDLAELIEYYNATRR